MRGEVLVLVNIPNSHFLLSLTHSAMFRPSNSNSATKVWQRKLGEGCVVMVSQRQLCVRSTHVLTQPLHRASIIFTRATLAALTR